MRQDDFLGGILQILTIILVGFGVFEKNILIFVFGLIPAVISIVTWYNENVKDPILEIKQQIKELRKDLNIQKEIENIRIRLSKLEK